MIHKKTIILISYENLIGFISSFLIDLTIWKLDKLNGEYLCSTENKIATINLGGIYTLTELNYRLWKLRIYILNICDIQYCEQNEFMLNKTISAYINYDIAKMCTIEPVNRSD